MRTPLQSLRLAAAALALAAFAAAPLAAQSTQQRRPPAVPTVSNVREANQALIDQAVRRAGFRPGRLTPGQVDAIEDAWADLLPEANPRRYRLNRAQAAALVYLALVEGDDRYGRPGSGGRYDDDRYDDDRYDDRPGSGPGFPGGGDRLRACREMDERAFEIGNIVDTGGVTFFLDPQEKERVRNLAREVQRTAVARGDRAVADRAGDVISSVSEALPHKNDVRPRVQALKSALEQACGRYDRR